MSEWVSLIFIQMNNKLFRYTAGFIPEYLSPRPRKLDNVSFTLSASEATHYSSKLC